MKRLLSVIVAAMFIGGFGWPVFVQAQAAQPGQVEISSEGAPTTDLPMDQYQAFDQFAQEHPDVVRDLSRNPRLIQSPDFESSHPALREFLDSHSEVRAAFAENPGDFLPLSPGVEARLHHR